MFNPGYYYVGDPVFILPNDELRSLLSEYLHLNKVKQGYRLFSRSQTEEDIFWLTKTPNLRGTVYDQNNQATGFDWGVFGCVPKKWIAVDSSFPSEIIEFTKPFECSSTEDSITIGHLHFTFNHETI